MFIKIANLVIYSKGHITKELFPSESTADILEYMQTIREFGDKVECLCIVSGYCDEEIAPWIVEMPKATRYLFKKLIKRG